MPVSVCAEGDFARNQEGDISVQKDTADTKQLDEVEVTAKNTVKPSSTPIQEFKQYRLKEWNELQV